jgi:hypothetical protein
MKRKQSSRRAVCRALLVEPKSSCGAINQMCKGNDVGVGSGAQALWGAHICDISFSSLAL